MFHLRADGGDHLVCPHCETKLSIEWTTEYGDPLVGDHDAKCPKCDEPFTLVARHQYHAHL